MPFSWIHYRPRSTSIVATASWRSASSTTPWVGRRLGPCDWPPALHLTAVPLADFHEADRLEALRSRDSPCRSGIRGRLATIHYRFGVQAFNRRSLGEAAVEFTDAIALAPSTAQYYVNRGIVLERMQVRSVGGRRRTRAL